MPPRAFASSSSPAPARRRRTRWTSSLWPFTNSGQRQEIACGWLTDKFGISWQIDPAILPELVSDPKSEKSQRAMKAMLGMKKLDIEALKRAYNG
jgi:predicted 3-demethylubiquinone-9 3-methyltransferase (glyoxalase superfamily)